MASSLAELASFLPDGEFNILESEFKGISGKQLALLKRKGVYCYDYMDSMDKININKLPEKKYFFSKLSDSDISDEDHALEVWNAFDIRSLGEYTELYLKTDVLLLASIFEKFRKSCMEIYGLDPAFYITAASLSWDSMFKFTRVRIELLTDVDQLLFIEKGEYC